MRNHFSLFPDPYGLASPSQGASTFDHDLGHASIYHSAASPFTSLAATDLPPANGNMGSGLHSNRKAFGSVVASTPALSAADQRYHCTHPGCYVSVKNPADLARHAKKHQGGPKQPECPIRGCPRQEEHGFDRKDKLNDHLRMKHKMTPL